VRVRLERSRAIGIEGLGFVLNRCASTSCARL